jgi:Na+/H+-dicarboxylate symporter
MVPTSIVDALAKNDILQILVFAILFGVALSHIGAACAGDRRARFSSTASLPSSA